MKKLSTTGVALALALVIVLTSVPGPVLAASSAQQTWNRLYKSNTPLITDSKFSFKYSDNKTYIDRGGDFGLTLKKTTASLEGSGYFNDTNPNVPNSDGSIKYAFGTNNQSWSGAVGFREVNGDVYLNLTGAPDLAGVLDLPAGSDGWVKVPKDSGNPLPSSGDLAENLWKNANIWQITRYRGLETLEGYPAHHFTATIDKTNLKKLIKQALDNAGYTDGLVDSQEGILIDYALDKLVDKIKVKNIDIWLGTDGYIYKVSMETNAPSVASLFQIINDESFFNEDATTTAQIKREISKFFNKLSFGAKFTFDFSTNYPGPRIIQPPSSAFDLGQKADDAKRLADVRQMASALELYYNDNNSYPLSLSSLSPNYMMTLPTAPTPPSGSCTVANNTYTYTYVNQGSYSLSFCLGSQTAGLSPGTHVLSQAGIQ